MTPDTELTRPVPMRLWVFAGLGAVAIHAACVALAVAHLRGDDEEALGAPAIEIGLELMAPRAEPSDLPPAPDSDASAASPALPEQKAVTEQSALPKETPVETEDPDRIVTTSDNIKPKKDEPVVAAVTTAPSEQSIAAEATAAPSLAAVPQATQAVAPAPGTAESAARIRASWQKELSAHFDRHKRYPANRAGKPAEIVVSFVLDRTGHILTSSIVRSSGDTSFDQAALAMLQRSDPVPAPPPLIADDGLAFTLPVVFRVKGKK
ncbi:MAG: periplasmic protein TonB [Hyphomicrobiales bacterium]|jgi:TonB family protein|nr:periplasmic protein TonB [Hyphomicrobiales bacterium]